MIVDKWRDTVGMECRFLIGPFQLKAIALTARRISTESEKEIEFLSEKELGTRFWKTGSFELVFGAFRPSNI